MMTLDEALAELRRCDAESRLESAECRATIANAVLSGHLVPAAALAEAQAEVARLEAALTQIRDREHPYPQFAWAMGIAGLALAGRAAPTDTGEGK